MFLPLLAWGFQKLFWTFCISLPAFSPNPSNGSSRYPCVHDCPSQQFLPCFPVTCLNNICNNLHAVRMNSFMLWGRQCMLQSTQTQIKYKHTKIYAPTLNIHQSNMYACVYIYIYIYIYIYTHTHTHTHRVNSSNTAQFNIFSYSYYLQNGCFCFEC